MKKTGSGARASNTLLPDSLALLVEMKYSTQPQRDNSTKI